MILIINTTDNTDITAQIRDELTANNREFEIVEAANMNISPCIGCNVCWLKTPGVCAIKDDYEEILKKIIKADRMWVISDAVLGFLNHKGKNIFDRILPIFEMYLEIRDGQLCHVLRYDKRTDIGVIYQGNGDRDYLTRWNKRCTKNTDSRALGAFPAEKLKEAIVCMQL